MKSVFYEEEFNAASFKLYSNKTSTLSIILQSAGYWV